MLDKTCWQDDACWLSDCLWQEIQQKHEIENTKYAKRKLKKEIKDLLLNIQNFLNEKNLTLTSVKIAKFSKFNRKLSIKIK